MTTTLPTLPSVPDALTEVPIIDTDTQIGIYIHVPFCQKHCPYCDFAVVTGMLHRAPEYVDALCAEIRRGASIHAPNPPVATVFLGGGTPSLLPAAQVARILDTVRTCFTVQPDAEITLEANPGPLRTQHLAGFRAAGVTRLSLGVQTFDPRGLAALGRLHTPEDARAAVHNARAAGFEDVSLDLIFGWEGQTLADWRADLETAVALRPTHISVYALTVEDGTPLAHAVLAGTTALPDDDAAADMFLFADELLGAAGYAHYEVSNYALPGHRSRHNCGYWQNGDYLGFGVGAHSHRHDRRWWNVRDLHTYLSRSVAGDGPLDDGETITEGTALNETVMLGLRLAEGLSLDAMRRRHGQAVNDQYDAALTEYVAGGLMTREGGRIALTARGRLLTDAIAARFLGGAGESGH